MGSSSSSNLNNNYYEPLSCLVVYLRVNVTTPPSGVYLRFRPVVRPCTTHRVQNLDTVCVKNAKLSSVCSAYSSKLPSGCREHPVIFGEDECYNILVRRIGGAKTAISRITANKRKTSPNGEWSLTKT